MNQHPVPQNVTQYQFRLVGDMTLKQFLELAGGLVLAVLFYSSNLLFIFKAPLILLSILLGIGLAFFPIEDRPLDQWFVSFIKSIYKPTRFTWKKTNKVPNIFTFTAHPIAATNTITKTIKAPTQKAEAVKDSDLSDHENTQVKSLNSLFAVLPNTQAVSLATQPSSAATIYDKPAVTVRKLKPQTETTAPPPTPPKKIFIPENDSISVGVVTTPTKNQPGEAMPANLIFAAPTKTVGKATLSAAETKMKSISLPVPPRAPNLIVGVATSKEGKLVEGAIVQVLDPTGLPARAMKTNALGQFATSTPLAPGTYRIEVEADGHTFAAQQLIINNTIISPFEIRATA
jgi:hypothetical protein